jgi:hypothetical protein
MHCKPIYSIIAPDADAIRYSNSSTLKDQPVQTLPSGEEAKSPKVTSKPKDHLCGLGVDNVWGGIPAKNHRGENLLLFIGIIDILQSYGMLKKVKNNFLPHNPIINNYIDNQMRCLS